MVLSTLGLLSFVLSIAITAQSLDIIPAEVNAFNPYTYFASAAYSPPSEINTWTCGAACRNNSDFIPISAGGNGDSVQFWYVGYSPSLSSVIVAHEGTVLSKIDSILTDADVLPENLDPILFPGISSSIMVHSGFANEQAKTAEDVLSAVRRALATRGTNKVTIIGHSLGGAIALLDSVYLPLHLPRSVSFQTITYGMPRVGNPAFADYVDAHLKLTHINNKKDPVPTLPSRLMGYRQPMGQIHITENGLWQRCPGQESKSRLCTDGAVPNFLLGKLADHSGPYNGIMM